MMRKTLILLITFCLIFTVSGRCRSQVLSRAALSPDKMLSRLDSEYQKTPRFSRNFVYEYFTQNKRIVVSGTIGYAYPDKYRADFETDKGQGYRLRTLMVYNGQILWQQQEFPPDKRIKVIKAVVDENYVKENSLAGELNPRDYYEMLKKKYNLEKVQLTRGYSGELVRMDFRMKPSYRARWLRTAEAEAVKDPGKMVPEKVSYFWSNKEEFCKKLEIYALPKRLLSRITYAKTIKNQPPNQQEFVYKPPPGTEIIDITGFLKQQDRLPEYEGTKNHRVGKAVPEFALKDIFGKKFDFHDYRGKIVVLYFWQQPGKESSGELSMIDNFYQEINTDPEIQLVTITPDKDHALEVVNDEGYMFPILFDPRDKTLKSLGGPPFPRLFVIDKRGRIASVYIRQYDNLDAVLMKEIHKLKQVKN